MSGLLAVEEQGRGEPLVMIHGLATTRQIWNLVMPELARTRRVVILDVPGFGASAPAGEGFGLDEVAERIARGLSARGVKAPYDLVGHSLGAGIAVTLAGARPRSVRRLVLVAPAGLEPMPPIASRLLAAGVDPLLAMRRRLIGLTDLRWGRRLLLGLAAADGGEMPPGLARQMIDASDGARRTSTALATITTADLRSALAATGMPVGVIWGTEDRTVPARGASAVRAARRDAEVVMLEGTGHVPMLEAPERFTAALESLLERLPKDATSSRRAASTVR